MAWFKVDDGLHDHRKTRTVRRSHAEKARDVAPFGIWVLAGSWAGANGTDGFVPTEVLEEWDDDALDLAARLVAAGLWWETEQDGEDGYGFHDWADYTPRPEGVTDPSLSGILGNHIRWHERREKVDPECQFCAPDRGDIGGDHRGDAENASGANRDPVPTRPDPSCASSELEREFAEWYDAYPRKRGRGQALRAYKAARKKADHETLVVAARQQTPHLTSRGMDYTPYPATWLNGERWLDEPTRSNVVQFAHNGDPILPPPQTKDWLR